ncbi:MAG: HAD family hydrolase [Candidatus Gracilibacteria bacterium]|nr:HAD family hydrolase [Candidatus Gracilibacteria bacterium]
MKSRIELAIFDLDGTLYELGAPTFGASELGKRVKMHHLDLISDFSNIHPEIVFAGLCDREKKESVPVSVSIGELTNKTRQEVFELIWGKLKPEEIILYEKIKPEFLGELKQSGMNILLLTAGPVVWADKALEYLQIKSFFDAIITAEMYLHGKGEVFDRLLREGRNPNTIVSIGDQEHSDITPAQSLGMNTCLVTGPKDIYSFFI